MSFSVQEFEQAVALSFELCNISSNDAENANLRIRVLEYLDRVKGSSDGWRYALEVFGSTKQDAVKFYCLQQLRDVLVKYSQNRDDAFLSSTDRGQMRASFMSWIGSHITNLHVEPGYVRNYLSLVYALILKCDYPENWPSAFTDLLAIADQGGLKGGVAFFLKVLDYVEQEVLSFNVNRTRAEINHNLVIKNGLRASAVVPIREAWYSIITKCKDSNPGLVRHCLNTMSEYFGWLDPALIVNDRFIPHLFHMLTLVSFRLPSLHCIREIVMRNMDALKKVQLIRQLEVVLVIQQVCMNMKELGRGEFSQTTSPTRKAKVEKLLRGLEVQDGLSNSSCDAGDNIGTRWINTIDEDGDEDLDDYDEDDEDESFMEGLGGLMNCVGLELIKAAEELQGVAEAMKVIVEELKKTIQLAIFVFLSHDDADIRETVLEFVQRIISEAQKYLKSGCSPLGEVCMGYLEPLLPVLMRGMCYPNDLFCSLELDHEEDRAHFENHRKELRKVYVNIARIVPSKTVIPFLRTIAMEVILPGNAESRPMPEVEIVLLLIYAFAEGPQGFLSPQKHRKDLEGEDMEAIRSSLTELVVSVQRSGVGAHPHSAVALVYNELTTRYIDLIVRHSPDLLPELLSKMASQGGIRHRDAKVRSHSCYLLLRIVKTIKQTMAPFAKDLLVVIKDSLVMSYEIVLNDIVERHDDEGIPEDASCKEDYYTQLILDATEELQQVKSEPMYELEDVLNLFEVSSVLIGSSWCDTVNAPAYLKVVIGSVLAQLEKLTEDEQREQFPKKPNLRGEWAAQCVSAFASASKGFTKHGFPGEIASVFRTCLEVSLKAMNKYPGHPTLRRKFVMFLHRMLSGMGDGFIEIAPMLCTQLLAQVTTPTMMLEFLQFFNQVIAQFREKVLQVVDQLLVPVLQRTQSQLATLSEPVYSKTSFTHEQMEYLTLKRALLSFLLAVVNSDASIVFVSDKNLAHLENILSYLSEGMRSTPHALTQKGCVGTLMQLVKAWIPSSMRKNSSINGLGNENASAILANIARHVSEALSTEPSVLELENGNQTNSIDCETNKTEKVVRMAEHVRLGFVRFIVEKATPSSFRAAMQPHLSLEDAASLQLLTSIAHFHIIVYERLGPYWLDYVQHVFLPSEQCPPNFAAEYVNCLREPEISPKKLRSVFKRLFLDSYT